MSLRNYDLRSEWYGAKIKQWGDEWPYVTTDDSYRDGATADQAAWEKYFLEMLRAFPESYRLYKRGIIKSYNFPEATPELFDPTYDPRPKLTVIRNPALGYGGDTL